MDLYQELRGRGQPYKQKNLINAPLEYTPPLNSQKFNKRPGRLFEALRYREFNVYRKEMHRTFENKVTCYGCM